MKSSLPLKFAVVMLICAFVYFVCSLAQPQTVHDKVHEVPASAIQVKVPPLPSDPRLAVIAKVNEQNRQIKTLVCGQLDVKTTHRLARISGTLCYEKPIKCRMRINSQLGPEIDLGSNETIFWFCSKRYQNGTLFYCKHSELSKSKLKTPFDPLWMMRSLGFDEIDMSGASLIDYNSGGKKWIGVVKNKSNAQDNQLKVLVLIDPSGPKISGYYLYDGNKVVASTEVIKYEGVYPRRWVIYWNEEGLSMELGMPNPQINVPIDQAQWLMPQNNRSVDMAHD